MKHLFIFGDTDTIAADNLEQALEYWFENTGEDEEDYDHAEMHQISDDTPITIHWDRVDIEGAEDNIPESAVRWTNEPFEEDRIFTKALASEWAAMCDTPVIVCSTEW